MVTTQIETKTSIDGNFYQINLHFEIYRCVLLRSYFHRLNECFQYLNTFISKAHKILEFPVFCAKIYDMKFSMIGYRMVLLLVSRCWLKKTNKYYKE